MKYLANFEDKDNNFLKYGAAFVVGVGAAAGIPRAGSAIKKAFSKGKLAKNVSKNSQTTTPDVSKNYEIITPDANYQITPPLEKAVASTKNSQITTPAQNVVGSTKNSQIITPDDEVTAVRYPKEQVDKPVESSDKFSVDEKNISYSNREENTRRVQERLRILSEVPPYKSFRTTVNNYKNSTGDAKKKYRRSVKTFKTMLKNRLTDMRQEGSYFKNNMYYIADFNSSEKKSKIPNALIIGIG